MNMTQKRENSYEWFLLGLRLKEFHHYRSHKMSIWLNLVPQLQKTGQNSIYPSHNSLTLEGPAWGVVRNVSGPEGAARSTNPSSASAACITQTSDKNAHHNETILQFELASKNAYSYALAIAVGIAGILCIFNGMLLLCLCQRRAKSGSAMEPNEQSLGSTSETRTRSCSMEYLSGTNTTTTPLHVHTTGSAQSTPRHIRQQPFASLPRGSSSGGLARAGGQRTILLQQDEDYEIRRARLDPTSQRYSNNSYVSIPRPEPVDGSRSTTATIRVRQGPPQPSTSSASSTTSSSATVRPANDSHRRSHQSYRMEEVSSGSSTATPDMMPIPDPPPQFGQHTGSDQGHAHLKPILKSPPIQRCWEKTLFRLGCENTLWWEVVWFFRQKNVANNLNVKNWLPAIWFHKKCKYLQKAS